MGSLMRKILSLMLAGSAFLVVPSVASANIVKGGGDTAFARTILGTHRDVGVHFGDVRLGPNGSVTVGVNSANQPSFADPNAVPEPGTWAMMLIGFGLVGYASRRRLHRRPRQAA